MVEVTIPGLDFVEFKANNRLYRVNLKNSMFTDHDKWKAEVESIESANLNRLKSRYRVKLYKKLDKPLPLNRKAKVLIRRRDGVKQRYKINIDRRKQPVELVKGKLKDIKPGESITEILKRVRFDDIPPADYQMRREKRKGKL